MQAVLGPRCSRLASRCPAERRCRLGMQRWHSPHLDDGPHQDDQRSRATGPEGRGHARHVQASQERLLLGAHGADVHRDHGRRHHGRLRGPGRRGDEVLQGGRQHPRVPVEHEDQRLGKARQLRVLCGGASRGEAVVHRGPILPVRSVRLRLQRRHVRGRRGSGRGPLLAVQQDSEPDGGRGDLLHAREHQQVVHRAGPVVHHPELRRRRERAAWRHGAVVSAVGPGRACLGDLPGDGGLPLQGRQIRALAEQVVGVQRVGR
mmetsp:Transcript_67378/g.170988  ORF Transcript_67378/g.170988 Transcript_67378/m.170988 type:complete len:262 (+) Transcript_67378:889-1674(+)